MRFTRAIVRPPAATFAAGITTSGLGPPELALALEQHEAYCRTLEQLGLSLVRLAAPGTVDGGDVCEAGPHFFIRLSERTNADGAAQLAAWLAGRGFGSSVIDIPRAPGLLHLKTGLSWRGGRRLLAVREVAGHEALGGWEVVRVPAGEEYAANCIRVNDVVLVAPELDRGDEGPSAEVNGHIPGGLASRGSRVY